MISETKPQDEIEDMNIDWKLIDEKIYNLKYPLSFIINIVKLQNYIEDYNLSLLLRFYFKNKLEICMKYPLFFLINNLDNKKFEITKNIIFDFYNGISKKMYFIKSIIEFKCMLKRNPTDSTANQSIHFNSFIIDEFINSNNFLTQRKKLDEIIDFFKSHFDASKNGNESVIKYISNLKSSFNNFEYSNNPLIIELKNRLSNLVNLFGVKFFESKKIILIKESQFDKFDINEKLKYVLYFYMKTEKYLMNILGSYDLLLIYDNKIKQIINPLPINILFIDDLITEQSTDSKVLDSDDIDLLVKY